MVEHATGALIVNIQQLELALDQLLTTRLSSYTLAMVSTHAM